MYHDNITDTDTKVYPIEMIVTSDPDYSYEVCVVSTFQMRYLLRTFNVYLYLKKKPAMFGSSQQSSFIMARFFYCK